MASDDLLAKTETMRAKLREVRIQPTNLALPMADAYIDEIEKTIATRLPDDYRWFVREYGACWTEKSYAYPIDPACPWGGTEALASFDLFYGREAESDDLLKMCHWFCVDRIPSEFIPIARDSGDNLLCLGVREPYRGEVYFWILHEETHPPTMDNMWFVASSFADLIASLIPDPGYATDDAA